VDSVGVVWF
jgi:hypothetical protein